MFCQFWEHNQPIHAYIMHSPGKIFRVDGCYFATFFFASWSLVLAAWWRHYRTLNFELQSLLAFLALKGHTLHKQAEFGM